MSDNPSEPLRAMRASEFHVVERNSLRGFFTLTMPSGLILRDCSLHRAADKEWVGLPAKPQLDADGRQRVDAASGKKLYSAIVDFAGKEARKKFQTAALAAVRSLLGEGA